MGWFARNWEVVAAGVGIAAVGLYFYEKKEAAASSSTIALTAGATLSATPKVGDTVILTLPTGASWANPAFQSSAGVTQPSTTSTAASFVVSSSTADVLTANWVLASSTSYLLQSATITITPHY